MDILHSVRVAAIAADAPVKWVDNVLSHYEIRGVTRSTHGVSRMMNDEGIVMLALCRTMVVDLGVSIARAVELAASVLDGARDGRVDVSSEIALSVSFGAFRTRLRARVRDAHEAVAHVRRGRPARRTPQPE